MTHSVTKKTLHRLQNNSSYKLKRNQPSRKTETPKTMNYQSVTKLKQIKTIEIRGESYPRHIAGLVKDHTTKNSVTGLCKHGARLMDIIRCDPDPPDSLELLITGTNDMGVGGPVQHFPQSRELDHSQTCWLQGFCCYHSSSP